MAEHYQYNYKPSGENTTEIINWLKHQHDKGYSLNLIIRKAIHQYGAETDLKQYMTDRFINDNYPVESVTPSTNATPKKQPVTDQTPTKSPKSNNPNKFLQKSQDDDQTTPPKETDDTPNLGFLSQK